MNTVDQGEIGVTTQIIDALENGQPDLALKLYQKAGGALFAFYHGYKSLGAILDKLPDDFWRRHESVLGGLVFYLTKQGRAGRAKSFFRAQDLEFEKSSNFELFGLLLALHLGDPVREDDLIKWRRLERQLPVADPLLEGLYYNSMLVMNVRLGRLQEARTSGQQAISCFREAGHNYLEHFIHLHLADLDLVEGRLRAARRGLSAAERSLEQSGVRYRNESDVIEIIRLALDYETGKIAHIPERAAVLRASLMSGDSWAELFIQLARISVMSAYFLQGRAPALEELEHFQADYARRHGGSSAAVDLLGALITRLDWRPGDAERRLVAISPEPLQSAVGGVIFAELRVALGQSEPEVNISSTPRGAIVTELQLAQRATGVARRHRIEKALWLAADEGQIAPFLEHRDVFLGVNSKLSNGRFARGNKGLARMTSRVLRLVEHSYVIPQQLFSLGFSPRQYRVAAALQSIRSVG